MALKLGMDLRHRIRLVEACTLCQHELGEGGKRIPRKDQLVALEAMLEQRCDLYEQCFECGRIVAGSESPTWRKRVDVHMGSLLKFKKDMEKREAWLLATQHWSKRTMSLAGQYWSGDCPFGHSEMYLNTSDYFECPKCRIQIQTGSDGVYVHKLKGLGKFKTRRREDSVHQDRISAIDELPGLGGFVIKEDYRLSRN